MRDGEEQMQLVGTMRYCVINAIAGMRAEIGRRARLSQPTKSLHAPLPKVVRDHKQRT